MRGFPYRIGVAFAVVLLSLLMVRCGLIRPHPPVAGSPEVATQQCPKQPPSEAAAPTPQPEAAPAPAPGVPAAAPPVAIEPTVPPQPEPVATPTQAVPPAAPQAGIESTRTPPPPAPQVVPAPQEKPQPPQPAAKPPAAPPQPEAAATGAPPATVGRRAPPEAKTPTPSALLDLNGLKQELKDTKAIGIFSKLTLKNQMDDLLAALRKFHQGQGKLTLTDLRRSYELLVMKVLSLVQDDDKKLASDIVSSREAIWSILVDPKRFAALQL